MNDKVMVTDTLNHINAGLKSLADMIVQTDNQQLRQTLQQMRNSAETSQYELYNMAKSLGYYEPAQKVSDSEIQNVKTTINKVTQKSQGSMSQGSMGQSSMSQGSQGSMGQSSMSQGSMGQSSMSQGSQSSMGQNSMGQNK